MQIFIQSFFWCLPQVSCDTCHWCDQTTNCNKSESLFVVPLPSHKLSFKMMDRNDLCVDIGAYPFVYMNPQLYSSLKHKHTNLSICCGAGALCVSIISQLSPVIHMLTSSSLKATNTKSQSKQKNVFRTTIVLLKLNCRYFKFCSFIVVLNSPRNKRPYPTVKGFS